jgi:parallel beta-helix repeat protein
MNVVDSSGITIAENDLAGATDFGAVLSLSSPVVLEKNTLRQSRLTGVLVLGPGTEARLETNQIVDNGVGSSDALGDRFGLVVAAGSATLRGNTIRGSAGHGVFVSKGANVILESNTITDNGRGADERYGAGVFVTSQSTGILRGNQIIENATDGIIISEGSTVTIEANTIAGNGRLNVDGRGHGIKLVDAGPVILNNEILSNRGVGIWGNSVTATVEGNHISGNAAGMLYGVELRRPDIVSIAQHFGFPYHVALNGNRLYWLETDEQFPGKDGRFPQGRVKRLDVKDGSVVVIFSTEAAPPASPPVDLQVFGSDLFWLEVLPVRIWRLSPHAEPRLLITGKSASTAMAVDDRYLYWADYGQNGALHRVDKSGAPEVELVRGLNGVGQIVAHQGSIYWVEMGTANTGTIKRVSRDGGPVTHLADGLAAPKRLAVDRSGVYWTESGSQAGRGSIKVVAHAGGIPRILVAELHDPWSIVLDEEAVYWAEWGGGLIRKVGKNGEGGAILAAGGRRPWGLAVDELYVFWSEELGGRIRKADKK